MNPSKEDTKGNLAQIEWSVMTHQLRLSFFGNWNTRPLVQFFEIAYIYSHILAKRSVIIMEAMVISAFNNSEHSKGIPQAFLFFISFIALSILLGGKGVSVNVLLGSGQLSTSLKSWTNFTATSCKMGSTFPFHLFSVFPLHLWLFQISIYFKLFCNLVSSTLTIVVCFSCQLLHECSLVLASCRNLFLSFKLYSLFLLSISLWDFTFSILTLFSFVFSLIYFPPSLWLSSIVYFSSF